MADNFDIPVIFHPNDEIREDRPAPPDIEDYYVLQKGLIQVSERHGIVGGDDRPPQKDYDFFFSDLYAPGDDGYLRIEIDSSRGLSIDWLKEIVGVLGRFQPWRVLLTNTGECLVILCHDRILVAGRFLAGCSAMDDLVGRLAQVLNLDEQVHSCHTDRALEKLSRLPAVEGAPIYNLQLKGITDAGLAHLSKFGKLKSVVLDNSKISDDGLALLKNLTRLRELWLQDTRITDAGLSHVAEMSGLRELVLGGTKVTDRGLVHLAALTKLRDLNLDRLSVSAAGLTHLRNLPNLRRLDLMYCPVGDDVFPVLQGIASLRELNVAATKITDAGIDAIEKWPRLKSLDVSETAVTAPAAERLKKRLRKCDIFHV